MAGVVSPRARRLPAWAAAATLFAHGAGAAASGEPRAKINAVDHDNAPELWLFATVLDGSDRPVPPSDLESVDVFMNGKRLPGGVKAVALKDTEHAVAVSLVLCGAAACKGPLVQTQGKGMQAVTQLARAYDKGTVWVYENNVRNLCDGKFGPLADAGGAVGKSRASPTAYRSKWLSAVADAVHLYATYDKDLPVGRVVVALSDGIDGRDPSGRASEGHIRKVVDEARRLGVRVHTVGYSADTEVGMGNLQLLSRKTGGTFRRAYKPSEVTILLKEVAAEIFYQHAIFAVADVEVRRRYGFHLSMMLGGKRLSTPQKPAFEIQVVETRFRWAHWGRIGLVVLIVLAVILLGVLAVLFVRRRRRRKKELDKAYKQAMGQEVDEEEAPAAAGGAGEAAQDGGEAAAGGAGAQDGAAAAPRRRCGTCGRAMPADWAECLFCKAGVDAAKGPRS